MNSVLYLKYLCTVTNGTPSQVIKCVFLKEVLALHGSNGIGHHNYHGDITALYTIIALWHVATY